MLKLCKIHACPNGTLGLHLSRAPWDPYPWVSAVQESSSAYHGGIRNGDTVLQLNGADVLGLKISQLAEKIRTHWDDGKSYLTLMVWRNCSESNQTINQQSLQKFATCLQSITQLLECPVCLEVVKPPGWQCCNGHVLCNSCRGRTVKCPICRVTLGPRGRCLLSDKLFTLLAESFPCDGVKNGTENGQCPRYYHNQHKMPTKTKNEISLPKKDGRKGQVGGGYPSDVIKLKLESKKDSQDLNRNYHCPTGKLCFRIAADCKDDFDVGKNRNETPKSMPSKSAFVANKIFKNFVKKPKDNGNEKVPPSSSGEWDVLAHLTGVHQMSVVHYYGTYGQRIQVDFMHTKSPSNAIHCISLGGNELQCIPPGSSALHCIRLGDNGRMVHGQTGRTPPPTGHQSIVMPANKTSLTPGNVCATAIVTGTAYESTMWKQVDGHKSNKSTSSSLSQRPSVRIDDTGYGDKDDEESKNSTDDHRNVAFSSHRNCIEVFFIARIAIGPYDNDDSNRMDDNGRGGPGVPASSGTTDSFTPCPNVLQSPSASDLANSGPTNVCIQRSLTGVVEKDDANGKRCDAIFLWHCGSDADVQKFRAVIECKRLGSNKRTGFIHPLTKGWKEICRSGEFLQMDWDGDESILDFVIQLK